MELARSTLLTVLAVVLAVYGLDCLGELTPEQAMQCCNSMYCSMHGHHGQDCCKTMPKLYAPFVTSSVHGPSFSLIVFAMMPASGVSGDLDSLARSIAPQCHAPPVVNSAA